jgi:hypothetical protein
MSFIITPLFIIIAGTGLYFFSRKNKKSQSAEDFLNRYAELLRLLTFKRNARLVKARATTATVMVKVKNESHYLSLAEVDERLIVIWKLESPELGKRGKEWSFNPAYSQNKMYEEVLTDIRTYQKRLKVEKGLFKNQRLSAA